MICLYTFIVIAFENSVPSITACAVNTNFFYVCFYLGGVGFWISCLS